MLHGTGPRGDHEAPARLKCGRNFAEVAWLVEKMFGRFHIPDQIKTLRRKRIGFRICQFESDGTLIVRRARKFLGGRVLFSANRQAQN